MKHQNWILLLDDDSSVREMLGRVLTAEGYGVLPAANGEEALVMAATVRIDLALLDLNLPATDGWDVFEKLTSENPLLPIIIITAKSNQGSIALSAGVGGLMEKPLDFPRLLRTIDELVAEPTEARLARLGGRTSGRRYQPSGSQQTA